MVVEDKRVVQFILDEQAGLRLYRRFLRYAKDADLKRILTEMIGEEERHIAIWQAHLRGRMPRWGGMLHMRHALLSLCGRLGGDRAIRVIIESIEVHGIRSYLLLAHDVHGTVLEAPLNQILRDELEHEAAIVGGSYVEEVTGERVRSFLLGFNDGLVEMLGAVVGFYATLSSPPMIMLAGLSVISAGAFSMAAGAYSATCAEYELDTIREAKRQFLSTGEATVNIRAPRSTLGAAIIVGVSYILGGLMPLLPVFFGVENFVYAVVSSVGAIIVVSVVLAFVSGISMQRRILLNIALVTAAVLVAMGIGKIVSFVVG